MAKLVLNAAVFLLFSLVSTICFSQPFSVEVIIKNQPDNKIFFGAIKGDDFIKKDSAFAKNGVVHFEFQENAEPGIYRLIFGKTTYAKVMGEEPQQLDFIFNNEDIVLETDFKSPEKSAKVIQSAENENWFLFKTKNSIIKSELKELTTEVDYYWGKNDKENAIKIADELNRLQIEHDLFITQWVKKTDTLFAGKLIATYREPMLDGYLTEEQRTVLFKREYLKTIKFTDEELINSQAYTDRIFNYLVSYNKKGMTQNQRIEAYKKAVDEIVANTNQNKKVFAFIIGYLKHGFGVLHLDEVNAYITGKYKNK